MGEQKRTASEEFLLIELSEIYQEFRRLRDEGVRRLNFYITLVSGFLGALLILMQFSAISGQTLHLVSIVALGLLFLLGWDTFRYLISRDIGSDFNMRAMARIRHYFVRLDPKLEDYVLWDTNDNPSFYVDRKLLPMTVTTMSILMGLLVALAVGAMTDLLAAHIILTITAGLVAFILVFGVLLLYARWRYKRAHQVARRLVKFPALEED